ncbi:MAG: hypothetical protein ABIO91_04745 [Pyrinomonadaceae bacterium]
MDPKSISDIASSFGLTIEPDSENKFRIYKGVNQIFSGDEAAVRDFFVAYENERPGLFEGSVYGYKE